MVTKKKTTRQHITATLLAVIMFAIFSPLHATQAVGPTRDPVSVSILPQFPKYGESVSVTLSSYGTDLTRAAIVWKEAGKIVLSGVGKTRYTTIAPNNSTTKIIDVSITLLSGQLITKTVGISPEEVDLLVETIDGYTPPFYRGRSLPLPESLVKVSAIPQIGGLTDSKDAVYTWTQNFKARPGLSGFGKRYYVYKNAFLDKSDTIQVIASTQSGSSAAETSKTVGLYAPRVYFYEDHPSEGILFGRAITDTFAMERSEATFIALPYFLSTTSYNNALSDNLDYTWKINGTTTAPTEKNKITLRKPEGSEGRANLSVDVKNMISTFQKGEGASMLINF